MACVCFFAGLSALSLSALCLVYSLLRVRIGVVDLVLLFFGLPSASRAEKRHEGEKKKPGIIIRPPLNG